MSNWTDVASKAMDFLNKPNVTGMVIILSVLGFLMNVIPLGVVAGLSWYNTDRLERAITSLAANCMHSVATRRQAPLSE